MRPIHPSPAEIERQARRADRVEAAAPAIAEVTVAAALTSLHHLTRETRKALAESKYGRPAGMVHAGGQGTLRVDVHKSSVARTLLIVDAVVKAAEKAGARFRFEEKQREMRAHIGPSYVTFRVRERVSQRHLTDKEIADRKRLDRHFYDTINYTPTGELHLILEPSVYQGPKNEWADGKTKVEDQLTTVVRGFFMLAEARKIQQEEIDERSRHWAEVEDRRHRAEEERRKEIEAWNVLRDEAVEWCDQRAVGDYLIHLKTAAGADVAETLRTWIARSRDLLSKRDVTRRRLGVPDAAKENDRDK